MLWFSTARRCRRRGGGDRRGGGLCHGSPARHEGRAAGKAALLPLPGGRRALEVRAPCIFALFIYFYFLLFLFIFFHFFLTFRPTGFVLKLFVQSY